MSQSDHLRKKTLKDVRIISHERVYEGHFHVEKYHAQYHLFEGGWSEIISREVFERGRAVGVLLYDPERDKVVLLEQLRIGALKDPRSPWLLEIVAGLIQEHEKVEEVARRETAEETGLNILRLFPIYDYWVSPGGCSEYFYLFCGTVDSKDACGIHGLPIEGENITVHALPFEEAYEYVQNGMINGSMTIIALQWLKLNKEKFLKSLK